MWKRSLDAVGLKIEFEIATWPELLKRSRAGTLMMWGYSWQAGSPDGGFFLSIAYGPNASEANDPRFALPAFDRVFGCRQHGFANVQAMQLNLPFRGDLEFGRLHAAIRLLLPILASRHPSLKR